MTRDLVVYGLRREAGRTAEKESPTNLAGVFDPLEETFGDVIADRGRRREPAERRYFHRSIGLTTPVGRKGSVTLRPSPAEAYAA